MNIYSKTCIYNCLGRLSGSRIRQFIAYFMDLIMVLRNRVLFVFWAAVIDRP